MQKSDGDIDRNFETLLQDSTLRSEYRRKVLAAIDSADNYTGDRKTFEELTRVLIGLEKWLIEVFGGADSKMFPQEIEDKLASTWAPDISPCIRDIIDRASVAFEASIKKLLNEVESTDDVILDTNGKVINASSGERPICEPRFQDRIMQFVALLREMDIYAEDVSMTRGVVRNNMMRKLSYVVFEIPKLDKQVLINDQVGEGTFVISGSVDKKTLFTNNKRELCNELGDRITKIIYRNPDQWRGDLLKSVFGITGPAKQEVAEYPPMDAAYFTADNIRRDLRAYADALKLNKIDDLTANKICLTRAYCANGDNVLGATYLSRAGVGLGLARTGEQAKRRALTMNELKKKAGLEIQLYATMNAAYFTVENIRHDLQAYVDASGVASTNELNTNNFSDIPALCANGENVTGNTYLLRAGVQTGLFKATRDAHNFLNLILRTLKGKAGIDTPDPMDAAYFTVENIRHDLQAYADALGIREIGKLAATNFVPTIVRCANGENVTGVTYLSRAGIAFGRAKYAKDAAKIKGGTLKELKKIIGADTASL